MRVRPGYLNRGDKFIMPSTVETRLRGQVVTFRKAEPSRHMGGMWMVYVQEQSKFIYFAASTEVEKVAV